MSKALDEVRKMMQEAGCDHNDGYVQNGFKKQLIEIYDCLHEWLDGKVLYDNDNNFIYESPDGGETIYRRRSGAPAQSREQIREEDLPTYEYGEGEGHD